MLISGGESTTFSASKTPKGKAAGDHLRRRKIRPLIAKQRTEHGSGLGKQRWVVERTISWLHQHRRLRIRYERRADIHEAFVSIACSMICLRQLRASRPG
jgi:transposase